MNGNTMTGKFNLVEAPVLRFTASGKPVANVRLANNFYFKKDGQEKPESEVMFISSTIWGPKAENFAKLAKGDQVFVTGRVKQENWETEEKEKRSTLKLLINNYEFLKHPKAAAAEAGAASAQG